MKHSKLTTEEILEAEKAKDARATTRRQGFEKMKERDIGYKRLQNFNGSDVWMEWGRYSDKFALIKNNQKMVFDVEEFRKWMRWA